MTKDDPHSGRKVPCIAFVLALLATANAAAVAVVQHDMNITLMPLEGQIEVVDRITLPNEKGADLHEHTFALGAWLEPVIEDSAATLNLVAHQRDDIRLFRIRLAEGERAFTLRYRGEPKGPRAERAAMISEQGVYLDARSVWYPSFDDELISFSMVVAAPEGWRSVSQGERYTSTAKGGKPMQGWREEHPQEDIYLVAAPFHEYHKASPVAHAMVLLRQADPELAQRYLGATVHYLKLYSGLLGPYPYTKFALVENIPQTGYGMPSFTLLGSRLIRLPFILHSSYPHEILHNWWGNGVYIDYESGNWSEGLTAYLADHLMNEQRGRGADYRRAALQKYADYVDQGRDFPLTQFRARHDEATQAVGYNKTLMLFHMLRRRVGDERFIEGLRRFYRDHRFQRASFTDLRHAFEAVSGVDLAEHFNQWVRRTGAPALAVHDAQGKQGQGAYLVQAVLEQTQSGAPYVLNIPVAITLQDKAQAFETEVHMSAKRETIRVRVPARPLLLEIDPAFDLFRRLDRREVPPSLGQVFGAERMMIVLPASAPKAFTEAYRQLAQAWSGTSPGITLAWDDELADLPTEHAVWVLGWENRFRDRVLSALGKQGVSEDGSAIHIDENPYDRQKHSVVVVARHPQTDELALAWLGTENASAVRGLARKLPHYSKYSFLVFEGDEPDNVAKGQWPVSDSPLRLTLDPHAARTTPAKRASRARLVRFARN